MGTTAKLRQVGPWRVALLWGVAAFLIHQVGNEAGWYFHYGWYQNLTHACSASALAGLLAVAGRRRGLRRYRLVAFVVVLAAVGALWWEAIEYLGLLDPFGVPLHFHDLNDAMVDMASNAVGVSLTLAVVWLRSEGGVARSSLRPARLLGRR